MRRRQQGGIFFRLLGLLLLAMLVTALYVARRPLLRLSGEWWIVEDRPEPAAAIVVLGDDNFGGERAYRAAQLFRGGLAPVVVASGRLLRPYAGIAELIERDLQAQGVPANAILRFSHRAANTREEAQALRGLAASRGWNRLLVVTSNYHTRRARYIFRSIFSPQVSVFIVSATDSGYDPSRWWESRQGRKLFFLETAAYLTALWESWDAGEASPPAVPAPPAPSPAPATH